MPFSTNVTLLLCSNHWRDLSDERKAAPISWEIISGSYQSLTCLRKKSHENNDGDFQRHKSASIQHIGNWFVIPMMVISGQSHSRCVSNSTNNKIYLWKCLHPAVSTLPSLPFSAMDSPTPFFWCQTPTPLYPPASLSFASNTTCKAQSI